MTTFQLSRLGSHPSSLCILIKQYKSLIPCCKKKQKHRNKQKKTYFRPILTSHPIHILSLILTVFQGYTYTHSQRFFPPTLCMHHDIVFFSRNRVTVNLETDGQNLEVRMFNCEILFIILIFKKVSISRKRADTIMDSSVTEMLCSQYK